MGVNWMRTISPMHLPAVQRGRSSAVLIRAALVLGFAAVALHELRYVTGADGHAGGHRPLGWLSLVAPLITIGLTGAFAVALAVTARRRTAGRSARLRNVWIIATGGLLTTFAAQELLQGALHPGHPIGLHGLVGHGGWVVVPLALLLGGVVAIVVGVARELERRWFQSGRLLSVWLPLTRVFAHGVDRWLRDTPLARNLAGRAPPVLLV